MTLETSQAVESKNRSSLAAERAVKERYGKSKENKRISKNINSSLILWLMLRTEKLPIKRIFFIMGLSKKEKARCTNIQILEVILLHDRPKR